MDQVEKGDDTVTAEVDGDDVPDLVTEGEAVQCTKEAVEDRDEGRGEANGAVEHTLVCDLKI